MAGPKTRERKLTAADLASYGILPKQPDGSKPVKGQEPQTLEKGAAVSESIPLFSEAEIRRKPTTRIWNSSSPMPRPLSMRRCDLALPTPSA
jgi:hypothetical protein